MHPASGYLYPSPYISAAAVAAAAAAASPAGMIIPPHAAAHTSLPPGIATAAAAAQIYDYPAAAAAAASYAAAAASQYGSAYDYSPYSGAVTPVTHHAGSPVTGAIPTPGGGAGGYMSPAAAYSAGPYSIPQAIAAGAASTPAYASLPPYAAQAQETRLQ